MHRSQTAVKTIAKNQSMPPPILPHCAKAHQAEAVAAPRREKSRNLLINICSGSSGFDSFSPTAVTARTVWAHGRRAVRDSGHVEAVETHGAHPRVARIGVDGVLA